MTGTEHAGQVARVQASELLADTPAERHGVYPDRGRERGAGGKPPRRVVMLLPEGCGLTDMAWRAAASIEQSDGLLVVTYEPAALVALGVVQLRHGRRERRNGPRS